MFIKLDSEINRYYVQTLAMIFFPGEKFGESESDNPEASYLYVRTEENEQGIAAFAHARLGDKEAKDEYVAEFVDKRTRERTLKLAVGGAVIGVLGELMGYRPAWGMLIGVRPSKVASEMLGSGMSKTRVKKTLASDYKGNVFLIT